MHRRAAKSAAIPQRPFRGVELRDLGWGHAVSIASGIERTLRTLLRSGNPSATAALVTALDAPGDEFRTGVVRVLAMREDAAGHRALVARLGRLPSPVRSALADVPQSAPMARTIPELIAAASPRLARQAAEAAAIWRLPDALAAIVDATRDGDDDLAQRLTEIASVLVAELERRLAATPSEDGASWPDPSFARRAAVNALVGVLNDYGRRGSAAWLDALLALAPPDEPALLQVLGQSTHPAHVPLVEALRTSMRSGVARLLGRALPDTRSPQALLDIAAARCEAEFLATMLAGFAAPIGMRLRENCQRIEAFAWLDPERVSVLPDLPGPAQAVAIALAAASKSSRRQLVTAIGVLLHAGSDEGKQAAARAIEHVPSHLAAPPLAMALESDEPEAAASAARLLRKKNIPQATGQLVGLLDHSDELVRSSAQRSLKEISFATYRDHYQSLDAAQRRKAGKLVGKGDPLALESVRTELRSGVARRRLKALELVDAMGVAGSLSAELLTAAEDRDAGVRCEAIRMLAGVEPTEAVRQAIREAATDRSPVVRDAAAEVAARMGEPALLTTGESW